MTGTVLVISWLWFSFFVFEGEFVRGVCDSFVVVVHGFTGVFGSRDARACR